MLRIARPLVGASSRALAQKQRRVSLPKAFVTLTSSRQLLRQPVESTGVSRATAIPTQWNANYSTKPPAQPDKIDKKHEKEVGTQKLEARPEEVSTESTVRHVFEGRENSQKDEREMSESIKSDLRTVKETLALDSVPREPYALGLAGTLPYLATSISTLYLAWDLRTQWPTDSNFVNSFMVSHETAEQWLAMLEPIQLGYGAVIISFLGAVHWGMEYGEKTPSYDRTRFRYGMGVIAPAIAWPTMLMPVQFALTAQFAAFTALYFADSRASSRGWAPPWYGTYRFVLTFIVGGAIFISLVGRAKVGDDSARTSSGRLQEAMHARGKREEPYSESWAKLEEEEKEKIKKQKEEEERKKKEEEKKSKKKGKKGKKSKGKEGAETDKSDDGEASEDGQSDQSGDEGEDSDGDEGKDSDEDEGEDSDEDEGEDSDEDEGGDSGGDEESDEKSDGTDSESKSQKDAKKKESGEGSKKQDDGGSEKSGKDAKKKGSKK